MNLPDAVLRRVEQVAGTITGVEAIGGGCIAHAMRVETATSTFFLKWAHDAAGGTFEAEAAGLAALVAAGSSLVVPEVVAAEDAADGSPGFLLTAWVESGSPGPSFEAMLGEGLAELHSHTEPHGRFGFGRSNFIGRLPQSNDWRSEWPVFFREMRLEPQIEMARRSGRWIKRWDPPAERLLARLEDVLPHGPAASICHGDLWSGNVICDRIGRPVLIDPASYFGHGETDLAMMTLFGGFGRRVFEAYHETHPRSPGHDDREAIYQLYHLLSHLNHFGGSYAAAVERVLQRFGG